MPLEDQVNYRWLREDNAVRFSRALLEHGMQHATIWQDKAFTGLTQAMVAEKTGISRPTVSSLAGRARTFMLRDDSLGLAIDPGKAGVSIGVDFSYGHNRVALSDIHGQLYVPRKPSDYETSVDETTRADRSLAWATDRILQILDEAELDLTDLRTIGVALAGPTDQATNKLVPDTRPMNSEWQHLSPVEELPVRLGLEGAGLDVPVLLDNDTNASAIAEYCWGAAAGAANTVYIKLNRSCSCALIIRHEIYRGAQGFAGEISHTLVKPQGGKSDSPGVELHDVFSVAALRRRFQTEESAFDLVKRAYGEENVREAFLYGARVLGEVLAPVIDVMNPELVVIGGKLGYECYPLIAEELNNAISSHQSSPATRAIRSRIKRGQIPGRTALRGAIALALRTTMPDQLAAGMPSEALARPRRKHG
jgi:predicted NBD/HSP70 family sugar kinase